MSLSSMKWSGAEKENSAADLEIKGKENCKITGWRCGLFFGPSEIGASNSMFFKVPDEKTNISKMQTNGQQMIRRCKIGERKKGKYVG